MKDETGYEELLRRLDRLIALGERALTGLVAPSAAPIDFSVLLAARWRNRGGNGYLHPVPFPDIPAHEDLLGIDRILERLCQNTRQFVRGAPANNVLLWGERGGGKSSAVKGLLSTFADAGLRLIEVQKEDLWALPDITALIREEPYRFILFCDDLSFSEAEPGYRELKALLEGGIDSRPENVLFYATSNRRHLMPERLTENTGEAEIHPEEAVAEKISLSDRFGITLPFYPMKEGTYLRIVRHLSSRRHLPIPPPELEREALQWAMFRGGRSGRVARQFIDDLSGRLALLGEDERS